MVRPQSIVMFERCYLGYLAAGAINLALHWPIYAASATVRRAALTIGEWYFPAATLVGLAVPLLLWYFAARRASVIAKWVIVVFFALNLLGFSASVVLRTGPTALAAILSLIASLLYAIAVWMLFRPQSREWFGETLGDAA